ncbi:MAG TPA: AAA family ATPase [Candidatus Binataceae bacterium]|jgi:MoxR-like ATPase|nr:AAA family ATPase [Candidatus Binataceae bacterium]
MTDFSAAPALAKLSAIRDELNHLFLERAELIDGALCALLSASHILVIGPPGTAKSMLADELCRRIDGANYFQWLLTRFSTPEELFGAVSLKSLEQDDYRRVTDHKLPEAHIAFLDEIFKANSSILNALLTLVNERIYHNGRARVTVPLITMFGASNELPDEEELTALFDRFMLRFTVDYIGEEFRFLKMLEGQSAAERTTLTLTELDELRAALGRVRVPGEILHAIAELRRNLATQQIIVSDRRWRNAVAILRAHAMLFRRDRVGEEDLTFLEHVLWKDPEEIPKVRETIRHLVKGFEDEARELLIQGQELREYANRGWENEEMRQRAVIEAQAKLANILLKFENLIREAAESGRDVGGIEAMRSTVKQIQQAILRAAL